MHAVSKTGGKQYRVAEGDTLNIEKLEIAPESSVKFDEVLMVTDGADQVTIGTPYIKGASVEAIVVTQFRDKKIKILKFKRRKHHMKRMGHRQWLTKIKITSIKSQ